MFDRFSMRGICRTACLSAPAFASFAAALVLLVAAPLRAQSCTWTVSAGDWSVSANWRNGWVPDVTWNADIINGGTAAITQPGATCNNLYLGDPNSANTGMIQMYGGGLSASLDEYVGNQGTGTFIQSGGTNNSSNLLVGYNAGSSGTYNQSAGTNTVTSALSLGAGGTYNLTGGALLVSGIQGTGAFNLSGGTLVAGAGFSAGQAMTLTGNGNINTGTYAVTLSDPLSGPGGLSVLGSGTLTLAVINTYTGNTLISGGTLAFRNPLALENSTLDSSGSGILSFGALPQAVFGGLTGGGPLTLNSAAAQGFTLLVGNNGASTTYSGAMSGSGSLAIVAGTLTLAGSNSFTGVTTLWGGASLVLANTAALAGSILDTSGGGTLSFGTLTTPPSAACREPRARCPCTTPPLCARFTVGRRQRHFDHVFGRTGWRWFADQGRVRHADACGHERQL